MATTRSRTDGTGSRALLAGTGPSDATGVRAAEAGVPTWDDGNVRGDGDDVDDEIDARSGSASAVVVDVPEETLASEADRSGSRGWRRAVADAPVEML